MRFQRSKTRTDISSVEPKTMYRLRLGKTLTYFFSERGNNRLKKIWLDNNLDEEMIFSSWIGGPSEAFIRQKVSDYLQAFLLRRSRYGPFLDTDTLLFLRRFSVKCDLALNSSGKENHIYYNNYIQSTLKKRYEDRENEEKLRIEISIARNELPVVLPGFEHVSKHPIFRAEQLEKRMKYLSKIPLPYNQRDFEHHILPIMTSLAIEEERTPRKECVDRKSVSSINGPSRTLSKPPTAITDDSGITSAESLLPDLDSSTDYVGFDTDLVQIFSDIESKHLNNILNDTLNDICEVCGGLVNCEINDELICKCVSDSLWDEDEKCTQTAVSLFEHAAKIVDIYKMKRLFCKNYTDQFECKTWVD